MSIIFPDATKMNLNDLIYFKKELTEMLHYDTYDINDYNKIREIIRRIEGYLLMADKKKLFEYFDSFYELGLLNTFNCFLDKGKQQISFCILECIYILLTNIQNTGFIFYLYSTKYSTFIPGESLNIIDKIISIDARKKEEFLSYQVNFIKSLALKLNIDCIEFFFNKYKNQFPILNKAFSLYDNKDAMIRSVVKNIYLTILKIDDKALRAFITAFPNNIYYPNIIFQLRNYIMKLCLVNFFDEKCKTNPIDKFRDEHDNLIDHMYYISDILLIGLDNVNFILINCILNIIIFPLIKVIISKKEEKVSIVCALYILILFIYIIKNKFINDVISYLLFEEYIPKNLLEKIKEYEFKLINNNIMRNVDSIIIHNQYADVNDPEWKIISKYMGEITGTDLSAGFIFNDNIYNEIKNIIYNEKQNNVELIKNEIFVNIKMLFTARDDCILLILNLLIHTNILFYNEQKNKIDENINDLNNNNKEDHNSKINSINNDDTKNKKENNNYNLNDDIIENIKNDLFDDDENENSHNDDNHFNTNNIINKIDIDNRPQKYNLFKNNFFHINISNFDNLFNLLLKSIENPKNFRAITNEIILSNISLLLKLNLYKEDEKKKIIDKITKIFKGEIQKLRKLFNDEENLKKFAFPTVFKTFENYIKPLDKKVNDLVTTAFILIPLIYLDNEEDTPIYLKEDKFSYQLIKIYILNIFILYDIINDLYGFQESLILKSKKCPLEVPDNKYILGKEYSENDIKEKKEICEIIIGKKIFKSIIFYDYQYIYFCQVLSNSFKDLSKLKIIKIYPLRNIDVKIPQYNEDLREENTILEIYDNSNNDERHNGKNKNYISANFFQAEKCAIILNILEQQKANCFQIEYLLFDSYIDAIERKISII